MSRSTDAVIVNAEIDGFPAELVREIIAPHLIFARTLVNTDRDWIARTQNNGCECPECDMLRLMIDRGLLT